MLILQKILCYNCKSLLCKGNINNGSIEIKCRKCGSINLISVTQTEKKTATKPPSS